MADSRERDEALKELAAVRQQRRAEAERLRQIEQAEREATSASLARRAPSAPTASKAARPPAPKVTAQAAPIKPVVVETPKFELPPDIKREVDYRQFYDAMEGPTFDSALRGFKLATGRDAAEFRRVAEAQGVDLNSIYEARRKGRTFDEIARANRDRGVIGFMPVAEREAAFRKVADTAQKAMRGEAPDTIRLKKAGADTSTLGFVLAGTQAELPEVSKPGEHGHSIASLLIDALKKDKNATQLYDLYGRQVATGATQKYINARTDELVKRAGITVSSPDATARVAKLRRQAMNEVIAYKTVGQWTPAITLQDVEVTEGDAPPGIFGALKPNVELIGFNNQNQAVFRQESPLGVLFRAIDVPQAAVVGALEGSAARGVQTGANFLEYALDNTEGASPYLRYPAVTAGFAASVFFPDTLLAGGAAFKGTKAAVKTAKFHVVKKEAVELLKTVAEARKAGDFQKAIGAEARLRSLLPTVADDLDRYDAEVAKALRLADPDTAIFDEDMTALIGGGPGELSDLVAREAYARVWQHPSVRKDVMSAKLKARDIPSNAYAELHNTARMKERVEAARADYIQNAPRTMDEYAQRYARGATKDVLADLLSRSAKNDQLRVPQMRPADIEALADIVATYAPKLLTDEAAFRADLRAALKAHPKFGGDDFNLVRQALYTPGKGRLPMQLARKLTPLAGKTVEEIQAADIALFDRALGAVEQNNEARGMAAALLFEEVANRGKIRVEPLKIFDDVLPRDPSGTPQRLSPGASLALYQVRRLMPDVPLKDLVAAISLADIKVINAAKKQKRDPFDLWRELYGDIRRGTDADLRRLTGAAEAPPPAPPAAPAAPAAPTAPPAPAARAPAGPSMAATRLMGATPTIPPGVAIIDAATVADAQVLLGESLKQVIPFVQLRDGDAFGIVLGDVRIVSETPAAGAPSRVIVKVGNAPVKSVVVPPGTPPGPALRLGFGEAEKLMEARVARGEPAIKGAPDIRPAQAPAAAPAPAPAAPAPAPAAAAAAAAPAPTPAAAVAPEAPAAVPTPAPTPAAPSRLPVLADTVEGRKVQLRDYLRANPSIKVKPLFGQFKLTPEDVKQIHAEVKAERKAAEEAAKAAPEVAPEAAAPTPAVAAPTPASAAPFVAEGRTFASVDEFKQAIADAGGEGFRTKGGSVYQVSGAQTQRFKADHTKMGHAKADIGIKRPSKRTIYLDATAEGRGPRRVSTFGLDFGEGISVRWLIDDQTKQAYLASRYRDAAPEFGVDALRKVDGAPVFAVAFSETPVVGWTPLELFDDAAPVRVKTKDGSVNLPGHKSFHPGTEIDEVFAAPSKAAAPTPAPAAEATPTPTVAAAPKAAPKAAPRESAATLTPAATMKRVSAAQAEAEKAKEAFLAMREQRAAGVPDPREDGLRNLFDNAVARAEGYRKMAGFAGGINPLDDLIGGGASAQKLDELEAEAARLRATILATPTPTVAPPAAPTPITEVAEAPTEAAKIVEAPPVEAPPVEAPAVPTVRVSDANIEKVPEVKKAAKARTVAANKLKIAKGQLDEASAALEGLSTKAPEKAQQAARSAVTKKTEALRAAEAAEQEAELAYQAARNQAEARLVAEAEKQPGLFPAKPEAEAPTPAPAPAVAEAVPTVEAVSPAVQTLDTAAFEVDPPTTQAVEDVKEAAADLIRKIKVEKSYSNSTGRRFTRTVLPDGTRRDILVRGPSDRSAPNAWGDFYPAAVTSVPKVRLKAAELDAKKLAQTLDDVAEREAEQALAKLDEQRDYARAVEDGDVVTKGELLADMTRVIELLGANMYNKPLAEVAVKELVQNAFDATKAAVATGQIEKGDIVVRIDAATRSIEVTDNGVGMTPEIVQKAMFTVAGTHKPGLAASQRSGGLGLAKMAFLFGSKEIELTTVKDGVQTYVRTNPAEIRANDFKIVQRKVPGQPNGTTMRVAIPEKYFDPNKGEDVQIGFYGGRWAYSFLDRPLVGPTKLTITDAYETVSRDAIVDAEAFMMLTSAKFDWGRADIYVSRQRPKYPKHQVLSSGLYQFDTTFAKNYNEKFPYDVIVDVKPDVEPTHPHYPFNNQREGFKGTIEEDTKALSAYLMKYASGVDAEETADRFKTAVRMERVDLESVGGDLGKAREAILQRFAAEAEATRAAPKPAIDLPIEITVVKGEVKDSTTGKVLVNQKDLTAPAESERKAKKSFAAGRELTGGQEFVQSVDVDPSVPLFHNNTNVDYIGFAKQQGKDPESFLTLLGSVVVEFRERAAKLRGYDALDNNYGVGVSIDKEYKGVHVRVPYHAFFLNPLAHGGQTPVGTAESMLHTLIHEAVHTRVSGHNENFTVELGRLYEDLADTADVQAFRTALEQTLSAHWDTFLVLRSKYDEFTTTNLTRSMGSEAGADSSRAGQLNRGRAEGPPGDAATRGSGRAGGVLAGSARDAALAAKRAAGEDQGSARSAIAASLSQGQAMPPEQARDLARLAQVRIDRLERNYIERYGPSALNTFVLDESALRGAAVPVSPDGLLAADEAADLRRLYAERGGYARVSKAQAPMPSGIPAVADAQPAVSRLTMSFKDVTKRVPELQEAAAKLQRGEITAADYDALVNRYKPATPYTEVPTPTTDEAMRAALKADQKSKIGTPRSIPEGTPVGLRLDIPAYTQHGAWVVSVHNPRTAGAAGAVIGYDSVASVKNAKFGINEKAGLNIAAGKAKSTLATVEGSWLPMTPEQAKAAADAALTDPAWRQVGMDPERHSYFYDRATMEPIVAADEVIQIGPLVLAKNPEYAPKSQFLYQVGPTGEVKGLSEMLDDGKNIIYLFQSADVSTLLHEMAHITRKRILDPEDMDAITAWIKGRGVTVTHEFGEFVGEPEEVEKAEELFAQAYERYIMDGEAPTPMLADAFERLKQTMVAIYRNVTSPVTGVAVAPEVKAVFDKMLRESTETSFPSLQQLLRREMLGRADEETDFIQRLSQEAQRKGIPRTTVEDLGRQFDTARKNNVDAKDTYISFPAPVFGKKDWSFDALASAQAKLDEERINRIAGQRGMEMNLAARSVETAALVEEETPIETLRSALTARTDEAGVPAMVRSTLRSIAATMFGGDVVREKGARLLPPEMRKALDTVERRIEESIGDTVTLLNDALETGNPKALEAFLSGEAKVTRASGRPIVSAGYDYMASFQRMIARAFDNLTDEERDALTKLADILQRPDWQEELPRIGFDKEGKPFAQASAEAKQVRDAMSTAIMKLLYRQGAAKDELGIGLAQAISRAVEATGTPRPTHEFKLVELMTYIAGKTGRGTTDDGRIKMFDGDSTEAVRQFLNGAGGLYDEASKRRLAVVIGGYGAADFAKLTLVKLDLGISEAAKTAFTNWIVGESWPAEYTEEIQRIINRYGLNPDFIDDTVLGVDYYIPRQARERMASALARVNYQPVEASTGVDAFNNLYRLMKARMTRGTFFLRQRYYMTNTVDHFIQLGMTVGFGPAANSVTRVIAQDLMVLPGWQQAVALLRKVPRAETISEAPLVGRAFKRDALEASRRVLQSLGDVIGNRIGRLFGAAKYRIEVNPILEGLDGGFRAGGRVYTYREIRNIAVEEGIFASFDTRQLAQAIQREGALYVNQEMVRWGEQTAGSLDQARTGRIINGKIRNFVADWEQTVADTAEAWGERERLGAMVALMEAGYDPRTAARLTIDALYDYSQSMTKADRSIIVGIMFPFWAFQKNANAQVFNLMFSPWGAYRMMAIRRARERSADLLTAILYGEVSGEYELDVESMPPELQDSYYALITEFESAYDGDPPEEAKRAMRLLLTGRGMGVEEGRYFQASPELLRMRGEGLFADLQKFAPYAQLRASDASRMGYLRERAGFAVPFPRTEAVQLYYSLLGDDHAYMEVFPPESSVEGGLRHITQMLATFLVMGSTAPDILFAGALTEGGLREVKAMRVLEPVFDPERSPILGPLLADMSSDAMPPKRLAPLFSAAATGTQQVATKIHPFIGKLIDDLYGTTLLRTPADIDPFVVYEQNLRQLTPEQQERIRAIQREYPDAGKLRDQRYYIPGGVWSMAFENTPFLGELNALLLRYEQEPLERMNLRGEILRAARGALGIDISMTSPAKAVKFEEPTKLRETKGL
jgi:hypothetical protein